MGRVDSNEKWIEREYHKRALDLSGWKISNAGYLYGSDFAFDDSIVHDVYSTLHGLFFDSAVRTDESSWQSQTSLLRRLESSQIGWHWSICHSS